jgi:hypothetical protein
MNNRHERARKIDRYALQKQPAAVGWALALMLALASAWVRVRVAFLAAGCGMGRGRGWDVFWRRCF